MSQSNYSSQQLNNYPSEVNDSSIGTPAIDFQQAIHLVKSILGLEYCLQYQIVPLTIKQNCLIVGMVDSEDQTAINFVRPIVKALGYGLTIQGIDSHTHQSILAEYLKQSHANDRPNQPDKDFNSEQTIAEITPQASSAEVRDSAMTITEIPFESNQNSQEKGLHDRPTLVAEVDRVEEPFGIAGAKIKASSEDDRPIVYPSAEDDRNSTYSYSSSKNVLDVLDVKAEPVPNSFGTKPVQEHQQRNIPVIEFSSDLDLSIPSSSNNYELMQPKQADSSQGEIPLTREALSTLSPRQLWQALLNKILDGGIGRLYLKQNNNCGRILWSQDGVVRSSLENVSLPILLSLIEEVKTLAKMPLTQLQKPKKVAIEKHHNHERLLLRIEMFPGKWGDEITIQVLRGKALKFYEQSQMKKMTEQALNLAYKLKKTLSKMQICFDSAEIGDLSELKKVQQEINRQLDSLDQLKG